jgi:site-specific DNA-methyltransferase (adenine-specific)
MTPKQQKYHFSSAAQDWETPQYIFDALAVEFGFTVDAAAADHNAKCERYWTEADNGLAKDWSEEIVWLNPPYKHAEEWMRKAWQESRRGATVVCLVPARTDSAWWHRYAMKGEIRLFMQRLKFKKGGKRSDVAPFPSALIIFRPPEFRFGTTPLRLEACRAV